MVSETIEFSTVTAPAAWASYLINGDASGFDYYDDREDEQACYEMERVFGICVDAEDLGFVHAPDYGLAGDCCRYTFQSPT